MGHQPISRWTCDNCGAVVEVEMEKNGSGPYYEAKPNLWQIVLSGYVCPSCVKAAKAALASRRKETPDAQS